MEGIKFKLNQEISLLDKLGSDYIYTITDHPTSEDIVMVHYQLPNGEWKYGNYARTAVEGNFKDGNWVKVE